MFLHMGAKRHTCLGFDVAYEFVPASLYRLFKKYPNVKQEDANKGFSMAAPNAEYINPFPESYRLVYQ